MEIKIRELPSGKFVACLPGSERIGPAVDSRKAAKGQVQEYLAAHGGTLQLVEDPPRVTGIESVPEESAPEETAPDDEALELPGKAVERDDIPEGHHLRRDGLWYKLFGPDGQKVGKARRKAEAAIAEAG